VSPNTAPRDPFANYGYGPNANLNFGQNGSPPAPSGFAAPAGANAMYATGQQQPSLSLNTNLGGLNNGAQMSPTVNSALNFPASALTQQQAAAQLQAANMFNYNMLGMGMMNYPLSANGQLSAFSPTQVR
jgi:hypothetical protein